MFWKDSGEGIKSLWSQKEGNKFSNNNECIFRVSLKVTF